MMTDHFLSQSFYDDDPLNMPECPNENSHAVYSRYSYDSLPRSYQDQYFLNNLSSFDISSPSYQQVLSIPATQSQMEWQQQPNNFRYGIGEPCYEYSPSTIGGNESDWVLGGQRDLPSCPRSWQIPFDTRAGRSFDVGDGVVNYLSPEDMLGGQDMDYCSNGSAREFARLSISRSSVRDDMQSIFDPKDFKVSMEQDNMVSCKSSEVGDEEQGDDNLSNSEDRMAEEPYAKLIYRALMGAPNHSMVLQEIYQWFIENTDKGNSTSSGWRNSIRHNLSMNAVLSDPCHNKIFM